MSKEDEEENFFYFSEMNKTSFHNLRFAFLFVLIAFLLVWFGIKGKQKTLTKEKHKKNG
jgi:hypothetical protein